MPSRSSTGKIGTSAQVLEFSSPQLANPVQVTLNVTHRRPLALIGIVVLLGLLAGAGVRRWLEPTIAKYEARLALEDLINRIVELKGRPYSAAVIAKLDEGLEVAHAVPRYATAQTILAKTKQVEDMVAAALASSAPGSRAITGSSLHKAGAWIMDKSEPFRLSVAVFVLKWARAVLLSIFLVLAAYGLYADTWTGSWQQLVTVASWAFALDIATEAVTKQLAKPAPA